MSSGNPFGLSDISHFGTFKNVGGKAGGFISKKFFHPSSFKNQEKLWKAMTEDERDKKKQGELERRRDEERQVEDLRKQMYLSGQGKATDAFSSSAPAPEPSQDEIDGARALQQKEAHDEFKRRKTALKMEKKQKEEAAAVGEPSPELEAAADGVDAEDARERTQQRKARALAKSRYQENLLVNGHSQVWGSWFASEARRWGFGCCKVTDREADCPTPIEEVVAPKKRRREQNAAEEKPKDERPKEEESPKKPLMDMRMFEAAERRKAAKAQLEALKAAEKEKAEERAKATGYLGELLADPAAEAKT